MKIAILDSATMGDDITREEILDVFSPFGDVFVYENSIGESLIERVKECDVAVVNKCKLTDEVLSCAENLKLICLFATGYDNVDIDYCKENGIAVCNLCGYSTDSVAQLTAAMVLSLVNHLSDYDQYVHSGKYAKSGKPNHLLPVYHEISSMTWGIVGCGAIGQKVAQIATAFGARVIVYTRSDSHGYEKVDIDTLCKEADIITLHTPLNDGTRHLINKDRIAMMKRNMVLVNVARGAVVDEKAVAQAIIDGKIGGIGVDVYDGEPITEDSPYSKLYGRTNVILTPHMAWGSYEARMRALYQVRDNIIAHANGENLNRVV